MFPDSSSERLWTRSVLQLLVFVASTLPITSAADPDFSSVRMETLVVDGIRVDYEVGLEELARAALRHLDQRLTNYPLIGSETEHPIFERREEILSFIAEETGQVRPGPTLIAVFEEFERAFQDPGFPIPDFQHLRIVKKATARKLLEEGWNTRTYRIDPNDPQGVTLAFQMEVKLGFTGGMPDSIRLESSIGDFICVQDLIESSSPEVQISDQIDIWMTQFAGIFFHEMVEGSLVGDAKTIAPFMRWFNDGYANVLSGKCLDRFVGPEISERWLSNWEPSAKTLPKAKVDLLGWSPDNNAILDKSHSQLGVDGSDYYRYSTKEVREILDRHGDKVFTRVLRDLRSEKTIFSRDFLDAFERITGEDLRKTFAEYGRDLDQVVRGAYLSTFMKSKGKRIEGELDDSGLSQFVARFDESENLDCEWGFQFATMVPPSRIVVNISRVGEDGEVNPVKTMDTEITRPMAAFSFPLSSRPTLWGKLFGTKLESHRYIVQIKINGAYEKTEHIHVRVGSSND